MSRILAVDYGRRRIGLAISDPSGSIALPYETWKNDHTQQVLEKFAELIGSQDVRIIVLGLPLTLRGERKTLAKEVERFRDMLKKSIDVPIVLWDERLTSVEAQKTMLMLNEKPSRQKGKVDRIAAVLLLQNFLRAQSHIGNLSQKEPD